MPPSASHVAPIAQSVESAQGAALHAAAPHAYGAQLEVAPGTHVPVPLHVVAAVSIDVVASHAAAGPQLVPIAKNAHMPPPSQVPSSPQLVLTLARQVARGSAPPFGTGWQLPALPATAHDQHAGQVAAPFGTPQHTDSMQWPLMHWVPSVQAPPLGVRFVHEPFAHVKPVAQSPSPPQVVRQAAPVSHIYAPQLMGVCLHVPAPLQKPTGVSMAFAHDAIPHDVAVEAFRHAPAPSHVPTKPQGGLAVQRPCGSAASGGTSLHVPSRPEMLQAWQVPHDGVPQHTPSTHALPVRQSSSPVHASPRRCLVPHLFVEKSQVRPGAQSASATQVVLHIVPLQT